MKKRLSLLCLVAVLACVPVFQNENAVVSDILNVSAEDDAEVTSVVDNVIYTKRAGLTWYEPTGMENKKISSITIPAKIDGCDVKISDSYFANENVFSKCPNLTEINVEDGNEYLSSDNGVLYSKNKKALIAYPPAKPDQDYVIPEGVQSVSYAFFRCTELRTITLPDSLEEANGAFCYCTNLEEINGVIPCKNSNPVIVCQKLKHIRIKGTLNSVSLAGYTQLEELNLSECDSVKEISIYGASALTELSLPPLISDNSTEYYPMVGEVYVRDCDNLKTIHLKNANTPATNDSTPNPNIENCPKLEEIIIEHVEGYSSEGGLRLKNLPALKSVTYYEPKTYVKGIEKCKIHFEAETWEEIKTADAQTSLTDVYTIPAFPEAVNCGNFTVYGYDTNEVLKYSCEKYHIPFVALDEPEHTAGDITGDAKIDVFDVITVNKAIFGKILLTDAQAKAADVNGDGVVNHTDSLAIMRYIVGLTDNFA